MARSTNTRERILDVAEDLFAQSGFAATSITDIAEKVGIRGPGVYKHYPNKLAIYEAVLARLFDPMYEVVEKMGIGSDPNNIHHQLAVILDHHARHPNISRLIQHATLAGGRPLDLLADRWYKPFFSFIHNLADSGEESWINVPNVMAFHSMVLGYVTLAPLHETIFGIDPLNEEMVKAQLDLHKVLVSRIGD